MTASLAGVMFWLSAASCVVAEVAIIRATLRVSVVSGAEAGDAVLLPHPRRWLEIVWVVLPAIALAALLLATARSIFVPHAGAPVVPPAANAPASSR